MVKDGFLINIISDIVLFFSFENVFLDVYYVDGMIFVVVFVLEIFMFE